MVKNTQENDLIDYNVAIQSENSSSYTIEERKSYIKFKIQTVFFAFVIILSQVGQKVILPLWIDSAGLQGVERYVNISSSNHSSFSQSRPFLDQYFVLLFSGFSFTILFGIALIGKSIINNFRKYDRRISHKKIFFVGMLCAVSAIFIVYPSSGARTAPYLQAILMNVSIPSTLLLRLILLKKKPTRRKLICAVATVLSLFVCLLPSIFPNIDPRHNKNKDEGGASGLAGVLWPLCFMLGYVLSSLSNVMQENLVKFQDSLSKTKVDLLYLMFMMTLFQFAVLLVSFWIDAIPFFGNVDTIQKVASNCLFGARCSIGLSGCSFYPGLYALLFIVSNCSYVVVTANLLRYCEGATLLAIISAVVTPLGFLFWTLFKEQPSFHWHPEVSITVWLNIVGLVVMVPSIYFYNTGEPEKAAAPTDRLSETSPLLQEPFKDGNR